MSALVAVLAVLWSAVFLARPRRPALITNESAWLVYSRHHGAWHRLMLTAVIVTLAGFVFAVMLLMHMASSDLFRLRNACFEPPPAAVFASRDTCWSLDDGNRWYTRSVGD